MSKALQAFREMHKTGRLSAAELNFAETLARLYPGIPEEVLVAGVVCVRYRRSGNICVELDTLPADKNLADLFRLLPGGKFDKAGLINELEKAECVGSPGEFKPLILEGSRLYFQRYHNYENELAAWITERTTRPLKKVTPETAAFIETAFIETNGEEYRETDWQKTAVYLSVMHDFLIISGGPGTGKTYTVQKILETRQKAVAGRDRVALAAPTGKAARRLAASLAPSNGEEPAVTTVHRLLGAGGDGSFRYGSDRKLPVDLLIIDEASMLDLRLWVHLIRALPQEAALIVLGDKDQLASVEAGAVLGDICFGATQHYSGETAECLLKAGVIEKKWNQDISPLDNHIALLTKSRRFSDTSGLKALASAINHSDTEKAFSILSSPEHPDVKWMEPEAALVSQLIEDYCVTPFMESKDESPEEQFAAYSASKILCAVRGGPFGTERINREAEQRIKSRAGVPVRREWYNGRQIMFTKNDAVSKVQNGETGIYFTADDGTRKLLVEGDPQRLVRAAGIVNYEPGYAITVHKSQGSEYGKVIIILPNVKSLKLSKEFLYTSVTRARLDCLVIGSREVLETIISSKVIRNSGLAEKLWSRQ